MSILIVSAAERGIVLGDVTGHPAQVTEPDWNSTFDGIPDLAKDTRRRLLERIEAEGMTVLLASLIEPTPVWPKAHC